MSLENLDNLSLQELRKLVKDKDEEVKKLKQEKEKEKLISTYKRLVKEEKFLQEKKEIKQKNKKHKSKSKSKSKLKSFQDYYQECIKGRDIPKDVPKYFKKALLKAKKEFEKGIKLEKSALKNFAEKYNIEGKLGLKPLDYFGEKAEQIKDFLRNHRNTKVRMIFFCLMENQSVDKSGGASKIIYNQHYAYFQSKTSINLEKTEVKDILGEMIEEILNNLSQYQEKGSGYYFKEVISLEIHIVE